MLNSFESVLCNCPSRNNSVQRFYSCKLYFQLNYHVKKNAIRHDDVLPPKRKLGGGTKKKHNAGRWDEICM